MLIQSIDIDLSDEKYIKNKFTIKPYKFDGKNQTYNVIVDENTNYNVVVFEIMNELKTINNDEMVLKSVIPYYFSTGTTNKINTNMLLPFICFNDPENNKTNCPQTSRNAHYNHRGLLFKYDIPSNFNFTKKENMIYKKLIDDDKNNEKMYKLYRLITNKNREGVFSFFSRIQDILNLVIAITSKKIVSLKDKVSINKNVIDEFTIKTKNFINFDYVYNKLINYLINLYQTLPIKYKKNNNKKNKNYEEKYIKKVFTNNLIDDKILQLLIDNKINPYEELKYFSSYGMNSTIIKNFIEIKMLKDIELFENKVKKEIISELKRLIEYFSRKNLNVEYKNYDMNIISMENFNNIYGSCYNYNNYRKSPIDSFDNNYINYQLISSSLQRYLKKLINKKNKPLNKNNSLIANSILNSVNKIIKMDKILDGWQAKCNYTVKSNKNNNMVDNDNEIPQQPIINRPPQNEQIQEIQEEQITRPPKRPILRNNNKTMKNRNKSMNNSNKTMNNRNQSMNNRNQSMNNRNQSMNNSNKTMNNRITKKRRIAVNSRN